MTDRKRMFLLIFIMITVCLVVTGNTILALYSAAFEEERARLMETVQSNARLIEAVARFDAVFSKEDHPEGAKGATLSQIIDAHKYFKGFGKTGEFTMAHREGDYIVFLAGSRHHTISEIKPVPFDSELAEPMRRALSGQSGTVVGFDYRGEVVLAAYEPVAELNIGLVAKIDLDEIRAPFLRAGLIAMGVMVLLVFVGTALFLRISNPIIRRLEEHAAELTTANESLKKEIAERKQAEAALELSEKRYKLAQRAANIGVWDWDIRSGEIYWSEQIEPMFGFDHGEFGRTYEAFLKSVYPEDRLYVKDSVKASVEEGKKYDIEHRIVWPDGTIRWVRELGDVLRDENGVPVHMLGVVLDISKRRQSEEELRISEEKFRSITTSAMSAIIMMDANGEIIFWNEAARKIFGWRAEEALGKDLHALLVPEQIQEASRKTLPLFKKTGQGKLIGKIVEHTAIHKNGEEVPIELSLSAVNIKGKWNAIGIVNDISMRKQAEETLKKAKELAEAANKAKSDFLSSMSHELRTPLTAVIGFAEVLKDQYFGKLNERQTGYVKDIFESGKHLLSLINDILDLSKVEAGKMELELSEINITHLLEYSMIMIKEKAMKHRIRLDIQIPEELSGLEIQADERKLKQVMFNLLSNAAKFTPDGGAIEVEAKQVAQELIISVSDTGIGIAPEDQEKIFDEFYQVIGGKKDKTPGTGLGLTIAMRFVKIHGGRLWVESKGKNKGSRFYFTLPLRVEPPDERASETPMPEIYDDKMLLIHLNKIISLSLEENRVFSLGCFYFEMENLQEKISGIKEVLNKMKRANDLLGMDINNNLYLILQGTNHEGAKGVCDRIIQKIENMIEGLKISYSLASFPEDGKTPAALLGKLAFLIQ